jgi:hypothetical protein
MKKLITLTLLATLFVGCSKDEYVDNTPADVKIEFGAYSRYTPDAKLYKETAKFFFFNASNGQKFKEERISMDIDNTYAGYVEYSKVHSEMYNLLKEHHEIELEDGTRVKSLPIKKKYYTGDYILVFVDCDLPNDWDSLLSENRVNIPEGKYYVVCLWDQPSGWGSEEKYSGKYITISKDMPYDDKFIGMEFSYDITKKGFVDWVTPNFKKN